MANPNTVDIRKFLTEFFSDEELTILCFDYFRDAYEGFAVGMAKGQKIQLLLERCVRREALPNLLAALRAERTAQYEARFGVLAPAAEPRPERPHPGRDPRQVFISHAAHDDGEFAHRLAADLGRVAGAPGSHRIVSCQGRNGRRRSTAGWKRLVYSL